MTPPNIYTVNIADFLLLCYCKKALLFGISVSPQKYLTDLRLEKSREFLMAGYGVTRSAILSGFNDLANFSKKYKAHYGISPIKNIKK